MKSSLFAAAAILALAAPALAQPMPDGATDATDLDTVVVTAAGFEQKIVDAPASISVINS